MQDDTPSIADPIQHDLFAATRSPVLAAWGAGVDSTAMLIDMVENGETIDHVLFADTGAEKPATYAFVPVFVRWLEERGVPVAVVRYQPTNFKNFPPYRTLDENCFTNGTLPSISFGFSSCSQKWKIAPQNRWTENWEPAQTVWAAGGKVTKLIGYDCSPADLRRYAEREGHTDERYHYRYPLRERGWTRPDCIARIERAGITVPPKSACYMCCATKPAELHDMPKELLRRIVLMEAVAAPRLKTVEGLWRKRVVGVRGGTPRPGSMTEYIRQERLLEQGEVEEITSSAPQALVSWKDAAAETPVSDRAPLQRWMELFDQSAARFDGEGIPRLYESERAK